MNIKKKFILVFCAVLLIPKNGASQPESVFITHALDSGFVAKGLKFSGAKHFALRKEGLAHWNPFLSFGALRQSANDSIFSGAPGGNALGEAQIGAAIPGGGELRAGWTSDFEGLNANTVTYRQPILGKGWGFGGVDYIARKAGFDYRQRRLETLAEADQFIVELRNAYSEAYRSQEEALIFARYDSIALTLHRVSREKLAARDAIPLDTLETFQDLLLSRSKMLGAAGNKMNTFGELEVLSGMAATSTLEMTAANTSPDDSQAVDQLLSGALEKNVSIGRAQRKLESDRFEWRALRNHALPDLDAVAGFDRAAGPLSTDKGYRLGLEARYNLPFRPEKASSMAAYFQMMEDSMSLAAVRSRAFRQTAVLKEIWKSRALAFQATRQLVAVAGERAKLALRQYQFGSLDLIKVLDAQKDYLQAQSTWLDARREVDRILIEAESFAGKPILQYQIESKIIPE